MFKAKDEPRTPDHGLASVIMYEGNNKTFVYKHPIENFNLGSQLIVHETQELCSSGTVRHLTSSDPADIP